MTDYLTNPATLGMAEGMGMTGMNGTGGFGGSDESPRVSYTLRVNGLERPVNEAWIGESLLYVLRERLGLAGAKGGCDQGECGACSVQLDGQLTAACLVPAALAADSEIRTVEGLTTDGAPSDVQRALAESGAVQCGYCVPGLAMAVHDLLERNHQPTELQAREALCGNLCRCTGYRGALAAVQAVAQSRADEAATADAEAEAARAEGSGAARGEEAPGALGETPTGETAKQVPQAAEPESPVYVELPAQQTGEPDPRFGPMDGGAADASAAQVPQYAGYPEAEHQQQAGEYHTGQFPLPDYPTGQFPVQEHQTGQFPLPEQHSTGQFPVQEHATGQFQLPEQHSTGQFPLPEHETGQFPVPDYSTGQFPVQDYATGRFPLPEQHSTGQFPVQEHATGQFPLPEQHSTGQFPLPDYPANDYPNNDYPRSDYAQGGYPQDPNGYAPVTEAEPGVYVLPHQQQHSHAPAPEAGA